MRQQLARVRFVFFVSNTMCLTRGMYAQVRVCLPHSHSRCACICLQPPTHNALLVAGCS